MSDLGGFHLRKSSSLEGWSSLPEKFEITGEKTLNFICSFSFHPPLILQNILIAGLLDDATTHMALFTFSLECFLPETFIVVLDQEGQQGDVLLSKGCPC